MQPQTTCRHIDAQEGKILKYSILQSKNELVKNLTTANDLLQNGCQEVILLPNIRYAKDAWNSQLPNGLKLKDTNHPPDALIKKNGKTLIAEFKTAHSKEMLIRNLNKSGKQADFCVIKMEYENIQNIHKIRARVYEAMKKNMNIKHVTILDNKGKIFYETP